MLVADRNLVDRVSPGTRVVVIGIYSVYEVEDSSVLWDWVFVSRSKLETKARSVIHISKWWVCVPMISKRNSALRTYRKIASRFQIGMVFRDNEKARFIKFSKQDNLYERLASAIAPEIFGHDIIKQAITCLLFGGVRKVHNSSLNGRVQSFAENERWNVSKRRYQHPFDRRSFHCEISILEIHLESGENGTSLTVVQWYV